MRDKHKLLRQLFRGAEAPRSGNEAVVIRQSRALRILNDLRSSRPPHEYSAIVSSFHSAAPATSRALFSLGAPKASNLVWMYEPFVPLSLDKELLWAEQWLLGKAGKINGFKRIAEQLQVLVLEDSLGVAKVVLDDFIRNSGWSLWAIELRIALLQLSDGMAAQQEWISELQESARNSIPGLLFQIYEDRNDETFSYDGFYEKCMNSLPRFTSLAAWLPDYLMYRALSHIENAVTTCPRILVRDITSSLIDYYESVIETIAYIEGDSELVALHPTAIRLVSALINDGYQDHRLFKFRQALSATFPIEDEIQARPSELLSGLYPGVTNEISSCLPVKVASNLHQCQEKGAAEFERVGEVVKWGLNLRSLDIGSAVALSAITATGSIDRERILPLGLTQLSGSFCIDDVATLSKDASTSLLRTYLSQRNFHLDDAQLPLLGLQALNKGAQVAGPMQLWLAKQLLEMQRFDELLEQTASLRGQSQYWARECAKLDVVVFIKQGRLKEAISLLEDWFRKNWRYALEFSADHLFNERSWPHFKDLDAVEVGLVSHYEFESKGSASVHYICKMACRKFWKTGTQDQVVEEFNSASDVRKAQLIAFLRDVWVDQNLAMCHEFDSTAKVRDERMSVLQLLLGWEKERASEYAEAIKEITLDQILRKGLDRIDQTRIFVNESAISRWAEKELEQDYERWRRLGESRSGGHAVDDMLRQYVIDPTNDEVLKEFASGKPTAADALLIDIIARFFKRFLSDPTDGLDTYLSVRIRHGSLRGTILGPLEEQGLFYSTSGFSREAFESRWDNILQLPRAEKEALLSTIQEFSKDVRQIVDDFVNQRVQIRREKKPYGAFDQVISPLFAKLIAASFAERPPSFGSFLSNGYFVFWKCIEIGLDNLRQYAHEDLAGALYGRVDRLINDLRLLGPEYLPLITMLTTASTMIKSQCDTVADWFRLPSMVAGERYKLADAIEIASTATKNVHRAFPARIDVKSLPADSLLLTPSALSVLMDCLFVIFENAWKHSGMAAELLPIELSAEFDSEARLLTLKACSDLSEERLRMLQGGGLIALRTKYLGELPVDLISVEGGSGFPKLSSMTRSVPRDVCMSPFDFGIEGDRWFTRLVVPLYEREGAFEAYE